MKKVLITGVTGYIGSRLAEVLVRDHVVYGLVRRPLNETYLPRPLRDKLILLPYDGGGESVAAALEESRPEVVYHLAAHYTAAHDMESVTKILEGNLYLGACLLEAMSAVRCRRLVYATTVTTHFPGPDYRPLTLYAAAKQGFSDLAAYYTGTGALRCASVALSDTYGPGDRRPKVLNLIRRSLLTGAPLDLTSGRQIYDAVYIGDVVQGFLRAAAALEPTAVPRQSFQLSGAAPRSLRETVELMLEVNGLDVSVRWGGRPDPDLILDQPQRIFPPPPGWSPCVPLEEGLRRFWADI